MPRPTPRFPTPRFTVRPGALVAYFVVFALTVAIALPYVTTPPVHVIPVDALIPGFSSHMSNLFLSFLPLLAYGFVRLLLGAGLREIVVAGLVLIAVNVGYEVFLPLWNTRDVMDAVYGVVGVLLAWIFLVVLKRHGLKPAASTASAAPEAAQRVDGDLTVGG